MKKLLFLLSAVLLSVSVSGQAVQQVNTLEDKIYGLSLLWSEIKYNFVNIDKLDFDVDRLYRETMRRVIETETDAEYFAELKRFLVQFDDAHTEVFVPEYVGNDIEYPQYGTALFGDKFYFTTYRINSDDTEPELLGAEIIEVEGMPAMEYAEKYVMPTITASTDSYRRNWAGAVLLNGPTGTYIRGKAICRDGTPLDFNIIRNGRTTRTDEDIYWMPPSDAASDIEKAVRCKWYDDVAVVSVESFSSNVKTLIDNVLNDVKKYNPKGLIIDLRSNGGGDTEVAWRLQMHLTDADSILSFGAQSRSNLGYGRAQGNYREEYEDYFNYVSYETFPVEKVARDKNIVPIACPVAILIGPYSFSACEDFLINIYEIPGRPVLIGECTAGSTGAPLVIDLPNEAKARICTLRAMYPYSGKPFVGGIEPDIYVQQTIDDYLKGKDTVLETALTMLALDIDLFN